MTVLRMSYERILVRECLQVNLRNEEFGELIDGKRERHSPSGVL